MSDVAAGFDAFTERCNRLGMAITLGPPVQSVSALVLGRPLDATLERIYLNHDGARWSAPEFTLILDSLTGPNGIEQDNENLRKYADSYVPRYPFEELVVFAQVGLQASHLATVPGLADAQRGQPVVYLDVHEDPWAVPIASSVDSAFTLLERCIDRATASVGRRGLEEMDFPLEVGDLIAADQSLGERVRSGDFAHLTRGDSSIKKWISSTFGKRQRA